MKGFRTVLFNVAAFIGAINPEPVAAIVVSLGFEVSSAEVQSVFAGIIAVINIGLRAITTTPIGKSA